MKRKLAIGLLAVVLLLTGLFQLSGARCFQLVGNGICRVDTTHQVVALTFDDGPTTRGVDAVLPVLAQYDARATFFVTGSEAAERPELVAAIAASGHEVANHTYTHRRMVGRLPSTYAEEIGRTGEAICAAGVEPARFVRAPYGKRLIGFPLAVYRAEHRLVMWDIEDPPSAETPEAYAETVLAEVHPGAIVLMHPMYAANQTARDALPLVLAGLAERGYRVVSVGELLELADE